MKKLNLQTAENRNSQFPLSSYLIVIHPLSIRIIIPFDVKAETSPIDSKSQGLKRAGSSPHTSDYLTSSLLIRLISDLVNLF